MILFLLAYLGGVLTIVSPCILPVLPFVFARADRRFVTSGLPMLVGLCLAFVAVASLASVAGGWAVQANAIGRWIAIVLLAIFGVTLIFPALADRLTRPLVSLGGRLSASIETHDRPGGAVAPSLALGVATGLLWAPCAGPILGLILTGAALQGANAKTSLLLLFYALGAATSLGLALLVGGRVFAAMKKSLHVGEWVRKGLGVLVLAGVAAIALGLDTGFLTQVSTASTTSLEQGLLDKLHAGPKPPSSNVMMAGPTAPQDAPKGAMMKDGPAMSPSGGAGGPSSVALQDVGPMPPLAGATRWFNAPPLTSDQLKGKVVLIDFWTYSCINCLRALPYVEQWAKAYGPQGLVVIGVHTPEFAFEKQVPNVEKAIRTFAITYPVAMDNDYALWKAFNNESWPAHYFIDAKGHIRFVKLGEGQYPESEQVIRQLLAERNGSPVGGALVGKGAGSGVEQAADFDDSFSPETYLGYGRAAHFQSPGGERKDQAFAYALPGAYQPDGWGLGGSWTVGKESATSMAPGAKVVFRFHARDLHMVLGAASAKPVRFRITIDGKPPGDDHGVDVDAQGNGLVTGQKLYQLVRQKAVGQNDRIFQIEFLDPGVQAYTFTFG